MWKKLHWSRVIRWDGKSLKERQSLGMCTANGRGNAFEDALFFCVTFQNRNANQEQILTLFSSSHHRFVHECLCSRHESIGECFTSGNPTKTNMKCVPVLGTSIRHSISSWTKRERGSKKGGRESELKDTQVRENEDRCHFLGSKVKEKKKEKKKKVQNEKKNSSS